MYGVAGDYQKTANDEILVIPMIETRQAVENIDEILDGGGMAVAPGRLADVGPTTAVPGSAHVA
jgi:4-hydroxy-2-oxoheptanedioate aldolase